MSWFPVFASYAVPAVLLLALSVVNRLRESRRELGNVRSRGFDLVENRGRRRRAMSGHGK